MRKYNYDYFAFNLILLSLEKKDYFIKNYLIIFN